MFERRMGELPRGTAAAGVPLGRSEAARSAPGAERRSVVKG